MSVKSAQAVTVLFTTQNPTTGAAADATGTPTGTLYLNGTANGATVTVTNITTGVYKAALTLPSLTAGDVVSLRVAATVATVAGEGVVWQDTTTAIVADEVWDEATSGHATAGTFGKLTADIGTVVSQISAKLGSWAGTGVNTVLGAFKALLSKSATLPTDIGGTFDPAADSTEAISEAVALVKVDTAAILVDTGTTLPAALTTIDDFLDTEIAAIKAKTDLISADGSVSVTAAISGSTITILRGDSLSVAITGLGDITNRSKLWWTLKRDYDDGDAAAIVQIELTVGLVRVNGADASARAANGSITVDDQAAGNITIVLDEVETDDLAVQGGLVYDVQMLTSTGTVTTLTSGAASVTADVTRAVA